jgi:hypothetical protein
MRITIERTQKDPSSFFRRKPPLYLVHVTVDLTQEELAIFRQQGVAGIEIYKDWEPNSEQYLPKVLACLIVDKPATFTFPNGAEAIEFERHLKGTILPALKTYLDAPVAGGGAETFEM